MTKNLVLRHQPLGELKFDVIANDERTHVTGQNDKTKMNEKETAVKVKHLSLTHKTCLIYQFNLTKLMVSHDFAAFDGN